MRNISITLFINLIFLITFISISLVFFLFIKFDQQTFELNQYNRFDLIGNTFLTQLRHQPSNEDITAQAKKLKVKQIKNWDTYIEILNKASLSYQKEANRFRFRVFNLKEKQYIYVQSIGYNLMFEIKPQKNYNLYIALMIFLSIFFIIFSLYIILLRKIRPLKLLNKKIQQFSHGNLGAKIDINSKDEIGQIASSFNEAIENINSLINSKNLFMKNIIHELKTPITKGLFLANMIETPQKQDKELLIKNFKTLNTIINQLSNIEKLKSNTLNITKEEIDLKGTINQIIIMLDVNEKNIIQNINDTIIIANKDLFGVLLKNLIENGLKYSKELPINLDVKKDSVIVRSKGEKLQRELSYYTQAFVQEKKNSQGFGLGLYIVNEIAKLHQFKLEYKYENGENCFILNIN